MLDDLQMNWNEYFNGTFHSFMTESDWNLVGTLLNRRPPLYTLDEMLLLIKFLIPHHTPLVEYSFFEQFAGSSRSIPDSEDDWNKIYVRYRLEGDGMLSFNEFRDCLEGFVRWASIRRQIRNRR